jgi:hypothetical protein
VSISCGFVHYLVCRKCPLDKLIIFTTKISVNNMDSTSLLDTFIILTTTISVNNMYSTSIVVIVPIIWLYITVVVVVISFSFIVSCIFISYCWLLLASRLLNAYVLLCVQC